MSEGWIYILTNPSYKTSLTKIGKTRVSPKTRAKQLCSTGVPEAFVVCHSIRTLDCNKAEREIHSKLDSFRHKPNKEFFDINPDDAFEIAKEVAIKIDELTLNNSKKYYQNRKEHFKKLNYPITVKNGESYRKTIKELSKEHHSIQMNIKSIIDPIINLHITSDIFHKPQKQILFSASILKDRKKTKYIIITSPNHNDGYPKLQIDQYRIHLLTANGPPTPNWQNCPWLKSNSEKQWYYREFPNNDSPEMLLLLFENTRNINISS